MNSLRLFALFFCAVLTGTCSAQQSFTVTQEPGGNKVYTGIFSRNDLAADSALYWYSANYDSYQPDSGTIARLGPLVDDAEFVLILGTWCADSKREVPHLYKIFDLLKIDSDEVFHFGVDRSKKSNEGTTERYNIQRVPTLIVKKGGKERGRIVERPVESLEKDLLKILSP